MWKAMLYKEWIKTRWYLLAAFAVLGGFAGYALVKLHRAAALMGAGHIWEVMVTRNAVFIDQMEYLPLLVGLLLAAVQFVPEMQRKCLKLTLHLPVPALATLTAMVGCGTAALLLLFGLCILLLAAGAARAAARAGVEHPLDGAAVVPGRCGGLPVRRLDDPRTDVETASGEHPDERPAAAYLFPRARAAGLWRLSARAGTADPRLSRVELALGRALHGRTSGLNL